MSATRYDACVTVCDRRVRFRSATGVSPALLPPRRVLRVLLLLVASSPLPPPPHARSETERGRAPQASPRRYAFSLLAVAGADWAAAVKELVTDANFDCNEEGIVSLSPPPHASLPRRTSANDLLCRASSRPPGTIVVYAPMSTRPRPPPHPLSRRLVRAASRRGVRCEPSVDVYEWTGAIATGPGASCAHIAGRRAGTSGSAARGPQPFEPPVWSFTGS